MLRGCLLALGFWGLLALGYFLWLDRVFERPASIYVALGVGFIVLCALGALNNAWRSVGDWSRISKARSGAPRTDGQLIAVCGKIHPLGQAMIAPFSQKWCVLCEYDLTRPEQRTPAGRDTPTAVDYSGFLMAPCEIQTLHGSVRLLGFPILEEIAERNVQSLTTTRNARAFIKSTEFEDRTGVKMLSVLNVFGDIWTDDDGLVLKNLRLRNVAFNELFPLELDVALGKYAQQEREHGAKRPDDEEIEDDENDDELDDAEDDEAGADLSGDDEARPKRVVLPKLVEKIVAIGAEVCVIGVFNEAQQGLLPPGRGGPPNRLLLGSAEVVERRLRKAMVSNSIGGTIALVLVHAALLGAIWLYRHSPETIRDQQHRAERAVSKADVPALTALVDRGLDVNFRDSEGRTLLMNAPNAAICGLLIEHDADVTLADNQGENALTHAARRGRTDVVKQLIAARAPLNPRQRTTGRTPLDEAEYQGHTEIVELLRAAGAGYSRERQP